MLVLSRHVNEGITVTDASRKIQEIFLATT